MIRLTKIEIKYSAIYFNGGRSQEDFRQEEILGCSLQDRQVSDKVNKCGERRIQKNMPQKYSADSGGICV